MGRSRGGAKIVEGQEAGRASKQKPREVSSPPKR